MSLQRHDPPGFVQDLLEENRQGWYEISVVFIHEVTSHLSYLFRSDIISGFMHTQRVAPSITPHFYDATRTQEEDPIEQAKVTWLAFPRRVRSTEGIDVQI